MSRSERRKIVHRRSRSLSFNSQSFDTAVSRCPQVVRKIPRIVFIQLRGRQVQSSARTVCFYLFLSPSPSLFSLRPTLVSATIFSSFQNRLRPRREDNGLHHRATGRSTRKRSHRSRSNSSNSARAISSFLEDHFATFARKSSSQAKTFLSRNLHLEEFIAIDSSA